MRQLASYSFEAESDEGLSERDVPHHARRREGGGIGRGFSEPRCGLRKPEPPLPGRPLPAGIRLCSRLTTLLRCMQRRD